MGSNLFTSTRGDDPTGNQTGPKWWDSRSVQLAALIALALVPRIIAMIITEAPILAWRPTDLAGIALNYYRHGLDLLHPQVLWGGNGPGYVEMEFPLIPFLTACLYKVFGVHDWVTLIIPLLSGIGLILVTRAFAESLYDSTVGFVAGVIAALAPTLVDLTVSLWPDPPMILAGAVGLFCLTRWAVGGRFTDLVVGGLATCLSILLKIPALYLGFPVLFLCFRRFGRNWWKSREPWLLAAIILVPSALWYWHAHQLYLLYHNTFGILSAGYLKFGTVDILGDPRFYLHLLFRLAMYHVGPLAFLGLAYGLFMRQPNRTHYVTHVWFAGVIVYLLVAARGVLIGHYQYLLPVIPPAAILSAYAGVSLLRNVNGTLKAKGYRMAATLLIPGVWVLFFASMVLTSLLFTSQGVYFTKVWENDRATGLAVGKVTAPGSLIVVVDNQMDEFTPERSMTPPNVFYFSDRRGWYRSMAWLTREMVEDLRAGGAAYLVITGNSLPNYRESFPAIHSYLADHFAAILENTEGIVYDLKSQRESEGTPDPRSSSPLRPVTPPK